MPLSGGGTMVVPNTFTPGNVITASGFNTNFTDFADVITELNSQLGTVRDWQGGFVTGGSSTAYTLSTDQGVTLADGVTVVFRAHTTSGSTPTLNVDSTGAIALQSKQGTAVSSGALVSGGLYTATYYEAAPAWIVHAAVLLTTVPITQGGTGQATATAGFDALAPTTTRGDIITRGASNNGRLAVGANNRVLRSNGTDPSWGQIVSSDITSGTIAHDRLASAVTASQSDMEAASSTATFVPPARVHNHPGVVKAWAIVTNAGTASISASYNIASAVRNSTGNVTLTFTNALAGDYAVIATLSIDASSSRSAIITNYDRQSGNFSIMTGQATGSSNTATALTDYGFSVMVLGDM